MATSGTQTDFIINDAQFNTTFYERLNVNINLWNTATRGGLLMTSKDLQGHFSKVTMYKRLAQSVVNEFDPRTKGTTTWTNLEQFENASVKVWRDMAISDTLDAFKVMLNEPNATFSAVVGGLTADMITKDAIETLVGALAGAIENEPTHVIGDYTSAVDYKTLNKGRFVYGDQYSEIACILTHSNGAEGMANLAIDEKLDVIAGYTIKTGKWDTLGIPVIVADIEALKDGANNNILMLRAGSAMVQNSEKVTAITQVDIEARPMELKLKREWAFNVGLKGITYDTTKTAYPTRAQLADKTFWKITASDTKELPCVKFKSLAI